MKVKFTIYGEPTGKGRPRFVKRGYAYTPEKTALYEKKVREEYRNQCKNYRFGDNECLEMRIYAFFGIPKSTSRKMSCEMLSGLLRPCKKPDMDNITKIIADSLNKIAYKDDVQIVDHSIRKLYADKPRVIVIIQTAQLDKGDVVYE